MKHQWLRLQLILVISLLSTLVVAEDFDFGTWGPIECGRSIHSRTNEKTGAKEHWNRGYNKLCQALVLPNDPRLQQSKDSPEWLNAVGRLYVETADGRTVEGSATLVTDKEGVDANIIVGARHTADTWGGKNFRIYFIIIKNDGTKIERDVEIIEKSGGNNDWAILKLTPPIKRTTVQALLISPRQYFKILEKNPDAYGSMAGYSSDASPELGNGGKVLTYDPKCYLDGKSQTGWTSTCYAYAGASGGAVVVTIPQEDGSEKTFFVGNIFGHRSGPDRSLFQAHQSYFVKLVRWVRSNRP